MRKYYVLILVIIFPMLMWGCSSSTSSVGNDQPDITEEGEKIFIVDRTGKKWDVTHAVQTYGFEADKFQFGLGPFAIKPILDPKMKGPGDPGYPDDRETFLVLGTSLAGDARAYPISVMSWHEVADEVFGEKHVAVAY
ncbi:MAG: DUF3179 domain-containing protein [Calditrichaeota bacterium]|nr:MAG: DUF3179 domain-containing protein [Calditrichota bacterium]